jgi:hypothetical protein
MAKQAVTLIRITQSAAAFLGSGSHFSGSLAGIELVLPLIMPLSSLAGMA